MSQHRRDALDEIALRSDQSVARPKQRSMLPQPGTPKSAVHPIAPSDPLNHGDIGSTGLSTIGASKPATSTSLSRGTAITGSRLGRLRPRSTYQTDSASLNKGVETSTPTVAQSMRPPSLINKPSATPSLGITRSQSLRRPAVASQQAPSISNGAHSRTQSTNTVPLARSNTARPRTTAERPKSMHIPSNTLVHGSGETTIQPELATARASTRLTGLSRSTSVKTRPDGISGVMRPAAATRSNEPALVQSKTKEVAKEEPKKAARPAFSTLQQHFTPRKAGKAPTATFLHPAPVTTNNSLSVESISLQMELLQLHLLHENAAEVSKQWEMSAKRALGSKFNEVASMYQVMLQHERSGQEQKNLLALLDWTKEKPSSSLVEHIQALSGPLHELPSLVQAGGRFQRHVSAFERWVAWIEEIRAARQNHFEAGLGSVEGLSDAWRAENATLMRRLSSFARDLSGLLQHAAESSIMVIVNCCQTLLAGLLEELQVMQAIESDVVSHEKEWVETRLQGIAADIGGFLVDETPAWHA
jgi:hypothetical protein